MTSTDLADVSATDLVRLYRRKAASPVEAARACLARIDRLNGRFGAFCLVDAEGALAGARAAEARWQAGAPLGPVDGVPTSIKDLHVVKGWPTRRGSRTTEGDPVGAEDAPAVGRLRAGGAVLLGKTTTPEFGWKGVTDNPLGEVARNPYDPSRTAGGSSGGAAVAAALGMGALHIGSDGGGSIRIPSGFSGIVGIKATFGRVAAWPASLFGTLSHVGPMTRTVADTALMLSTIAGFDSRDWLALPDDGVDYRIGLDGGVRGLRIAFSPDLGHARVDPAVAAAVAAAVQALAEQGAVVETVDPGIGPSSATFDPIWFAGTAAILDAMPAEKRGLVDPGMQRLAARGAALSSVELQRAAKARAEMAIRLQRLHDRYDILVTPTLPIGAFAAGREVPEGSGMAEWMEWTPFSYPFNLSQQPAATVPCGLTPDGLPIGIQLVGAKYADALVLRVARAVESAVPMPKPPVLRADG
ncbi:MAG: amidase [Geminicoccaceae bacterium]